MAQDDDFGLPDLNYKPLDPKPEQTPKTEKKPETKSGRIQSPGNPTRVTPKSESSADGDKSNTSVIVGILVPILILVGGYFGYLYLYKKPKEKAAQEAAAKIAADKKKKDEEAARQARLREEEEARRLQAEEDAKNANPPAGTIESLSAATGRFYVVAASSIDGDLIMDEAKRKSASGISTKIIPPFGKWKFYRLTISDHDSFALAQASADEIKAEYNGQLWVMRY
jgi:hypothetical protein